MKPVPITVTRPAPFARSRIASESSIVRSVERTVERARRGAGRDQQALEPMSPVSARERGRRGRATGRRSRAAARSRAPRTRPRAGRRPLPAPARLASAASRAAGDGTAGSGRPRAGDAAVAARLAVGLDRLRGGEASADDHEVVALHGTSTLADLGSACAPAVPDRRHAADDGAARGDPRARPRDGRGRLRHDLARRGLPVVAEALDGGALVDGALGARRARDRAARRRLGDHLAVHAPSDPDRDGGARDAGGGRAGPLLPRPRRLEDLHAPRRRRVEAGRGDEGGGRGSSAACSAARRSTSRARSSPRTFRR